MLRAHDTGTVSSSTRESSRHRVRLTDALSPRRGLPTTVAGVEMGVLTAFLGLRTLNVAQLLVSAPSGVPISPRPQLDALLMGLFVVESLAVAVIALRRSSLRSAPLAIADVATACLLLLMQALVTDESHRVNTWQAWGFAVTLSSAMLAGMVFARRWQIALAAAALMISYLTATLGADGGAEDSTAITNAIAYVAFALVGRTTSSYLRRLAVDADTAREQAVASARAVETERHRRLLHDQATVLHLLSQDLADPVLAEALRRQAAKGATRIASFMAGERSSPVSQQSLAGHLLTAADGFADLPLTCTVDLVTQQHLPDDVGAVLRDAVTTLLHNVRQHARASACVVHADGDPQSGWWEVVVRDDGVGFDVNAPTAGYGLDQQVRQALGDVGVEVVVESAPGEGATVTMTHPPARTPRHFPGAAVDDRRG